MIKVPIYYSVRNNFEVRFFADKECAMVDQKLEGKELSPNMGEIHLEVEGFAYVDEVMTREEYVKELQSKEQTQDLRDSINLLRR